MALQAILFLLDLSYSPSPVGAPGTQILAALLVGLLIAFALQLLLTNLGIALGLTALGFLPKSSSSQSSERAPATSTSASDATSDAAADGDGSILPAIGFFAGLSVLLTIDSVLFVAGFLAVKFSQVSDRLSGSIAGLVIWAAYLLILTWLSSSTLSSIAGSLLGSAASGFRRLVSTLSNAIHYQSQGGLTEESAIALVRNEMQSALNATSLQQTIEDYVQSIVPPKPDLRTGGNELAQLLQGIDPTLFLENQRLVPAYRQNLSNLLQSRFHLSAAEAETWIEQIEAQWSQMSDRDRIDRAPSEVQNPAISNRGTLNAEAIEFLHSASPVDFTPERLKAEFAQLLQTASDSIDWQQILKTLWQRVDLSEIDIASIWQQFQTLKPQLLGGETGALSTLNILQVDIEDYLQNAPYAAIVEDNTDTFIDILYDPDAAPDQVRSHLIDLQPEGVIPILQQRGDLDAEEEAQICDRLESAKQTVLARVKQAEIDEQREYLKEKFVEQLQHTPDDELTPDRLLTQMQAWLADSPVAAEIQDEFFTDKPALTQLLKTHAGLKSKSIQKIVQQIETVGDRATLDSPSPFAKQLESYLRYTNPKRLTLAGVQQKLEHLASEHPTLPKFSLEPWSAILERRSGLNDLQRRQILEQIEDTWQTLQPAIADSLDALDSDTRSITNQVADNLISIAQSLKETLATQAADSIDFADLKGQILNVGRSATSVWMLRQQFSQLDWQQLADRLKEAGFNDLEIAQLTEPLQSTVQSIVKTPRRWAKRTQRHLSNLQTPDLPKQAQLTWDHWLDRLTSHLDLSSFPADSSTLMQRLKGFFADSTSELSSMQDSLRSLLAELPSLPDSLRDTLPTSSVRDTIDRFSQTLFTALMQSQALPDTMQDYVSTHAEALRDRLLEQIESVQLQAKTRVDELKQQAQRQIERTRKVAAVAAWWLFATASTAAISAAIAGGLATQVDLSL